MALNSGELLNIILSPDAISGLQKQIEDSLGTVLTITENFAEGSEEFILNELTQLVPAQYGWIPATGVGVPAEEAVNITLSKDELSPPPPTPEEEADPDYEPPKVVARMALRKGSSFASPVVYVRFLREDTEDPEKVTGVEFQVFGSCETVDYEDLTRRYFKGYIYSDGSSVIQDPITFPVINSDQECFNIPQAHIGEDVANIGIYVDEETNQSYVYVPCDSVPDSFVSCNNPVIANGGTLEMSKDGNDYFQVWNGQPEVDGEPNSQWKAGFTGYAYKNDENLFVYTEDNLETMTLTFKDRITGDVFVPNNWIDLNSLSDDDKTIYLRQNKRVYLWTDVCEYSKDQMENVQAEVFSVLTEAVREWLPWINDQGLPETIDLKYEKADDDDQVRIVRETRVRPFGADNPPASGLEIYRDFNTKKLMYEYECQSFESEGGYYRKEEYQNAAGDVLDPDGANKPEYATIESNFYDETNNPTLVKKTDAGGYDGWLDKNGGDNAPQSVLDGKDAIKYIPQRGSNEIFLQETITTIIPDILDYLVDNMEVVLTVPEGTFVTDVSLTETEVTGTTEEDCHRHGGTSLDCHTHDYTYKEYDINVTKGQVVLSVTNGNIEIS